MAKYDVTRYRPLGLVANPFSVSDSVSEYDPSEMEIGSQSNLLLSAIDQSADEPSAKPIRVLKTDAMPPYYHNRAISRVERSLAADDGLEVLHAYILMFMMRLGRVRATLQIVSERLAFRDFDKTLTLYVGKILAETDESLISYQVLGEEGLSAYRAEYQEDPAAAVAQVFGIAKVERRPELAEVADTRPADLTSDVEDEDTVAEIDETVGDAPGTEVIVSEEQTPEERDYQAILDYLVEYTQAHLSPVIARALRVYKDRGLVALTTELNITKAPRKTLAAVIQFARVRFRKVVLIYDGFDNWGATPVDIRSQITGTLSELRWMLESDAAMVMVLPRGVAPELEEQFASGKTLDWDFPGMAPLEAAPDVIDAEMLDRWLASAAAYDAEPLTVGDPILSALLQTAEGSLKAFVLAAGVAIENAAERGVSALDAEALEAGKAASWVEADPS